MDGQALRFGYTIPKENVAGLVTPYETIVVEADAPPRPLADTSGRFAHPEAEMTCTRLYLVIQYPDGRVGWPSLGGWTECDYEETSVGG